MSAEWVKVHLEEVDSTNTYLRDKIREGEYSHAAVSADSQVGGLGRLGRRWVSPAGGLYLSVAAPVQEQVPTLFGVAVGVAVVEVLQAHFAEASSTLGMKWPNDLIVYTEDGDEFKVGGILGEFLHDAPGKPHVLVGVGLNVNTLISKAEIEETSGALTPGTLKDLLGSALDLVALREALISQIIKRFDRLVGSGQSLEKSKLELLEVWKKYTLTLGREVRVHQSNGVVLEGFASDIDNDFALLLTSKDGSTQSIQVGDCVHLRAKS